VLARLERELGAELDELWGQAVAGEWLRALAVATTSRARLVAVDATGIPTGPVQRALAVLDEALPFATTIVVAHHGARLDAGSRRVQVLELVPAPAATELEARLPAKELMAAPRAALAVPAGASSAGSTAGSGPDSGPDSGSDSGAATGPDSGPDPDPSDTTPREEVTA
jgi:RND superfamily putative drug exporter